MPYVIEDIDLEERRFGQPDVIAITGLPAKTLQNWNERGLIPGEHQKPRKGGRRLYTGFEVMALGFMAEVTNLTRLPPADALEIARAAIAMITELLDNEKARGSNLLVYFYEGYLNVRDDHPVNIGFDFLRESQTHILVPVERIFHNLLGEMAKRMHGENWEREKILSLPARELRRLPDFTLESVGLTRDDIEKRICERTPRRRKKKS